MEELKRFYDSFEIKTARQFKDAVKTMAEYAGRIPDGGVLELDNPELCQVCQTFWTAANCVNRYIEDREMARTRRGMDDLRRKGAAI